jgi:hypothetical protein
MSKLAHATIGLIIHEINVAQEINCNEKARTKISDHCKGLENILAKRWNELNIWLKNNPQASYEQIQFIREKLTQGKYVRDDRLDKYHVQAQGRLYQ